MVYLLQIKLKGSWKWKTTINYKKRNENYNYKLHYKQQSIKILIELQKKELFTPTSLLRLNQMNSFMKQKYLSLILGIKEY